jgi:hypothetical protein
MNYTRPRESTNGEVERVEILNGEIQLLIKGAAYSVLRTGIQIKDVLSLESGKEISYGKFIIKRLQVPRILKIYYPINEQGDQHTCTVYRPYLRKAAKRGGYV